VCAIIDKSAVGSLFSDKTQNDYRPFLDWVLKQDGTVAIGGKNREELAESTKMRGLLAELKRARKLVDSEDRQVDEESKQIEHQCSSNDSHVIALARVSGARLLVLARVGASQGHLAGENLLEQDFRDRALVKSPRGRIYKDASGMMYAGRCPKCGRFARALIDPRLGVKRRFFVFR